MNHFDEMIDDNFDLAKVQDRGSKKWVAMMLPEHVKFIRDYKREQKKVPRPQLDEWDLHAIEETINIALKRKCDVLVKLWKDGEIVQYGGIIESVDLKRRTIDLDNPFGIKQYDLDGIVDVTTLE